MLACFALTLILLNLLEDAESHCLRNQANFHGKRSTLVSLGGFLQVPHGWAPLTRSLHGWRESLTVVTHDTRFTWSLLLHGHLSWEPWRKRVLAASHSHSFPSRGEPNTIQLLDAGLLLPVSMWLAWCKAGPNQLTINKSLKCFSTF